MIRTITGTLVSHGEGFAVIGVHGIGLKVSMSTRTIAALPPSGKTISIFTYLNVKENALDLYGFPSEPELRFFELLISVAGVGPKSALSVLDAGDLTELSAAIAENRPDLLSRAVGIGRKTAERIIVELRTKIRMPTGDTSVRRMDADADLLETLVSLGYRREEAKAALSGVDAGVTALEARLKAALGRLSRQRP